MKTLYRFAKENKLIGFMIAYALLGTMTTGMSVVIYKVMVSTIEQRSDRLFMIYIGMTVLIEIIRRAMAIISKFPEIRLTKKIRLELVDSLVNAKRSCQTSCDINKMSVATQGITMIAQMVPWYLENYTNLAVSFVTATVLMIMENSTIGAIVSATTIPMFFIFKDFDKRVTILSKKKKESFSNMNAKFRRFFNVTSISLENTKVTEESAYEKSIESHAKDIMKKCKVNHLTNGFISIYYSIVEFVIIWFAIDGQISMAATIIIIQAMMKVYNPIFELVERSDITSELIKNIEIINEFISEMKRDEDGNISLSTFDSEIKFNNVSFAYNNSGNTVKNINLSIKKGMKVGIYGPSGCGKSTLMNLITRFYRPQEGTITIDGIDINELTKESILSRIGIVSQFQELFTGTILENVTYGCKSYTMNDVIEACKKASAYDFIMSKPQNFDSLVGDNGIELSGGERQRLILARMFLKNPEILILDEATSALDRETEIIVQRSIDQLSEGKTVIAIAHRVSTIKDFDLLIGIENHTIKEVGNNESLMNSDTMWRSYNK